MERLRQLLLLAGLVTTFACNGPALAGDADFDALLSNYVVAGADGVNRVDYARWKASPADLQHLDGYIDELGRRAPSRMARNEAFVFWVNLYNAMTLKVILDKYPVVSIRDIKSDNLFDPKAYQGPWRTKRVSVEGRGYSLDDIEHDVLRPVFKDPRVHYAVNCASLGCPNLQRRPWRAAALDADLDAAARAYVNHPRGVTALADNSIRVSSLYKWFAADFGSDEAGLVAHLRSYAAPALSAMLTKRPSISGHDYDWSLNDLRPRASGR